ncbi:MAG: cold-shock protein [Rhodothermales bacterium]|nr:cold-shock protein [Rhodothermales bacterium]
MALYESVVKWFDAKKGYGFLVDPDGGEDIFIHYSQIASSQRFRTLRTGQRVQYGIEDGPKGIHAINVEPIDSDESAIVDDVLVSDDALQRNQPDEG